jgi:hypothetical protein
VNPLSGCTRRLTTGVLSAALALAAILVSTAPGHAQPPPPVCVITVDPATVQPDQPFTLCGPEGEGYTYTWEDWDNNVLTHERCYTYASGLPAGTYDFEFIISQGEDFLKCPYQLVISEQPEPPTCDVTIRPEGDVCDGQDVTLCGPVGEGFTYTWNDGEGALISHERCITVGPLAAGVHEYELVVSLGEQFVKCPVEVVVKDCEEHLNCPRTPGFWTQQCAQRENGSTKFTVEQMTQITQDVDARSAFFNWGGETFSSFCGVVDPPRPMDPRKQAKRQFACLLANVSTGALGLIASNGAEITLDPATPIECAGLTASTIGELIVEVDGLLGQLEGQSLEDAGVKATYGHIIGCCDAINNGIGIGPVCREDEKSQAQRSGLEGGEAIELHRATPNPFSGATRLAYSVADGGETVDIGVYDVAGRMVRRLASGYQAAGRHLVSWDGSDAAGVRARSGVYFVRGMVGGRPLAARLLLLH